MPFVIEPDGTALDLGWTEEVEQWANTGARQVFGTLAGAIRHAGVQAAAVSWKTEQMYDAKAWLETGAHVPVGEVTTMTIEEV